MKSKLFFSVLLLCFINFCKAQDSTIVLKASMLDKFTDQINLSTLNGWIFKHESDTGFSKININTTGWEHLKPSELNSKYADKNGRVEGWFRIKIKFDSSFLNQQIGFDFPNWAATKLYVDGKFIASRGNMGQDGRPFRDYLGDIDAVPMRFETSGAHIFAVHFVAYLSPIPPHGLKTATQAFVLLGPNYVTSVVKQLQTINAFTTTWLAVCAVLAVLFWLLLFQNRQEKNLFWIALCTTVLTLLMYCLNKSVTPIGVSFISYTIYGLISNMLLSLLLFIIIPFLLAKVFKRKLNRKLLVTLVIVWVSFFFRAFLPNSYRIINVIVDLLTTLLILGICFYYIITSWKNLKGAQWAIVVGLLASIFSLVALLLFELIFKNLDNSFYFTLSILSCFVLSFPLSLLVYVSIRFKEIIKEVQQNAARVVSLSEEKKEQALNQQKVLQEEVKRQTTEIRNALENLKSTQSQLIQSEKMASLGELTAGIAHEIQNPLNFVNNFSEVNKELVDELQTELHSGNTQEAIAISNDIKDNEEKINHHGKRADAIVKGMLQHSRSSTGVKELTNINALADEYLRLSYHGLRAKDKNFNATMKTDFDKSIEKINIIPQDIGRVLLNLYNNAFYAVTEKAKQQPNGYEPTISVSTKKMGDKVVLTVKDKGNGIPQKVVDKIFQPFFTTKPTGQGTGLGLSLSYDIVKAHGGEIKVGSKEGEGSEFTILLPV